MSGMKFCATLVAQGSSMVKIATIVDIFEESVYVQFKGHRDPIEMFTWRFEHVDKDMKRSLSCLL